MFSLTQAACCLGIDAKTLRRWLNEAQLPSHPQDARQKGINQQQIEQLVRLHQRSLASSPLHSLLPPSSEPTLATLSAMASALHEQIATLQQVATLTHLLQQSERPPQSRLFQPSRLQRSNHHLTQAPAPLARRLSSPFTLSLAPSIRQRDAMS